jgi:hypothetical protein
MSSAAGGQQYTSLPRVDDGSPLSEQHTDDLSAQIGQMQKKLDELLAAAPQPMLLRQSSEQLSEQLSALSEQLSSNTIMVVSKQTEVVNHNAGTGAALSSAIETSVEAGRRGEEEQAAEQGPEQGRSQKCCWDSQKVALMISIIAALLAWADMRQGRWQTTYLAHQTNIIDLWAFFQAKMMRSNINRAEFWILSALRNSTVLLGTDLNSSALDVEIARARFKEQLLRNEPGGDGAEQLFCVAKKMEGMRDAALEHYETYEYVVTAFQVMIVLASTSVITKHYWFASIAFVGTVVTTACMINIRLTFKDTIEDSYVENDHWLQLCNKSFSDHAGTI